MTSNKKKSMVKLKIEEIELIGQKLNNGEEVRCKNCKELLVFHHLGSGYHPGIYCPNGCTEIFVEMGSKKD